MQIALFGLPQTGKSTIFSLLTGLEEEEIHYDSSGVPKPQIGTVSVRDERVDFLADKYSVAKKVYPRIEYLDIVGLKFGDVKENQLLAHLRQIDLLAHIVRAFRTESIFHSEGTIDPLRDINRMEEELILSDLIILDSRLDKLKKTLMKSRNPEDEMQCAVLEKIKPFLESGRALRGYRLTSEEERSLRSFGFISQKPLQLIINIDEEDISRAEEILNPLRQAATEPPTKLSYICGSIELEISRMDTKEAEEFMQEYRLKDSGKNRLINDSFSLLNLISFLTVGKEECRAWPIPEGITAVEAAGSVHTDMQRGFISARVIKFSDFEKTPDEEELKKKGLLKMEGRNYKVCDGDIIDFKFNV